MSDDIFHDLPAPPVSPEEREMIAEKWLRSAEQTHGRPVDILAIVKSANVTIVELTADKMGEQRGIRTASSEHHICAPGLQERSTNTPLTLFKLAHEFSHCVLHRGALAKPLKSFRKHFADLD